MNIEIVNILKKYGCAFMETDNKEMLEEIENFVNKQNKAISDTRCCTKLKDKEEMNLVEYAISEGYTYNNENHYFYKGGRNYLDSNVRDKYIKEVVMLIDITKHL